MVGWFSLKVFYRKSFPPRRHPEPAYTKKNEISLHKKEWRRKSRQPSSLSLSVAGLPGNVLGVLCFRRRMQFTFFSCFAFPWKIFAHFRKATPSLFSSKRRRRRRANASVTRPHSRRRRQKLHGTRTHKAITNAPQCTRQSTEAAGRGLWGLWLQVSCFFFGSWSKKIFANMFVLRNWDVLKKCLMHSTNFKYKQAWNLNKSALQCNINKMMHVVSNILVKRSFFIPSLPEHDYALEFALKPGPSQNSMSFFCQTKPDSPCKPLSKSSVSLEIFPLLQSISLDLHRDRPRPQFGGN